MIAVIALIILAIAVVTGILAVLMVRKRRNEGKPQANCRIFSYWELPGFPLVSS